MSAKLTCKEQHKEIQLKLRYSTFICLF